MIAKISIPRTRTLQRPAFNTWLKTFTVYLQLLLFLSLPSDIYLLLEGNASPILCATELPVRFAKNEHPEVTNPRNDDLVHGGTQKTSFEQVSEWFRCWRPSPYNWKKGYVSCSSLWLRAFSLSQVFGYCFLRAEWPFFTILLVKFLFILQDSLQMFSIVWGLPGLLKAKGLCCLYSGICLYISFPTRQWILVGERLGVIYLCVFNMEKRHSFSVW